MTISRYCAMCDISYNDAPDSCPLCKAKQLLKMAEDEAVYYDNHARKQERRADRLEAELEELKQKLLEVEQTTGILCDKCGWSMKFPDEPCRCELQEKVDLLRSALTRLFDEATNSSNIYTHDGWNIRNPYVELPKDVEEQVREILRTTRKAETDE